MRTPRKRPSLRLRKPVAKPPRVHVPKTAYSRRRAKAASRSTAAEETEPDGEPDPEGSASSFGSSRRRCAAAPASSAASWGCALIGAWRNLPERGEALANEVSGWRDDWKAKLLW